MPEMLLEEGQNTWRIEKADRIAWFVGGRAYFRAFRRALLEARKHVCILAWDIHSRIRLERDGDSGDDLPIELGPFLNALLDKKANLEIHLLVWDYSMIYAAEREWRLFSEGFRDPHPRLHLHFDDQLPAGASHHQKVVLVDDSLAFTGGIDLSAWRWDSAMHSLEDDRRTDPKGNPYDPHHDLQVALTGAAARALGDLCAERWERAVGSSLPRSESPDGSVPWLPGWESCFQDVEVGIARTYAAHEPWPEVREVEQLHLDLIASAREYLYFENQYFSSRRIAESLEKRLREPEGPEVIIVLTREAGWLEEGTMGLLRNRLFEILSEADTYSRLRLLFPQVADEEGNESSQVYVHAKLLIADDRYLKVGSSNLSNRSMRVDSEVDIVIERPEPDPAIRDRLFELLAIHFAIEPADVAERVGENGSLCNAVDSLLTDTGHSLQPYPFGCNSDLERRLADTQLLDPDEPPDPAYWIRDFLSDEERPSILRRLRQLAMIMVTGILLALLFKEGWGDLLDREAVVAYLDSIKSAPFAPLILLLAVFVTGLVGAPLNLVIVAATLVMGPWQALACGYAGAHLSANAGFGLGQILGKPLLDRWGSGKVDRLNRKLRDRGILSVVLVRILPIAPFVIVNLVAGASHLRFGVFNLGTFLGMAPGIGIVVLLTHQLDHTIRDPGWGSFAALLVVVALVVGSFVFLSRVLVPRSGSRKDT